MQAHSDPHYTHVTPRAISVCRKNVCKNVCVSNMYVDLYAIQLTVLLLDYCTPAEHPHLHPHPRILPNTHTYTHANFGEPGIRNTYTHADFGEPGIRNTYTRIQKISGASPLGVTVSVQNQSGFRSAAELIHDSEFH